MNGYVGMRTMIATVLVLVLFALWARDVHDGGSIVPPALSHAAISLLNDALNHGRPPANDLQCPPQDHEIWNSGTRAWNCGESQVARVGG